MENNQKYDLLVIYRNYLFALQTREEFGEIYGDTQEIIDYYEQILTKANILKLKKRK
ncbi:MAG: hypothetical protein IKR74_01655 [Bacilli bacterium]|nr:hypothetical protein [Bacilli bacterium]